MVTILIIVFIIGYMFIALENAIDINKAAAALVAGVLTWVVYAMFIPDKELVNEELSHHIGSISNILFFLLGAMTIVELIDAHDGFEVITAFIKQTKKWQLIWIIGFLTFFLSAILDNLTTTIVMVSLLRKLIQNREDRLMFVGLVVIAANAGGAWTPIGDVTTTMLWIGGQLTASSLIGKLIIPSLFTLIVPALFLTFTMKGNIETAVEPVEKHENIVTDLQKKIILVLGVLSLVFVPVFKTYTHLPPFMGMLFGVGILWFVTEIMHKEKKDDEAAHLTIVNVLQKVDISSIIFFAGILLSVAALESAGVLTQLADFLNKEVGNQNVVVMIIGVLSSIVDNVPLVAASQGMYSLADYPVDSSLWTFMAYAAGTGGSILIIGSAAGVAAMGLEKVDFFWYLRKIGWLAFLGFLSGALVYILLESFVF